MTEIELKFDNTDIEIKTKNQLNNIVINLTQKEYEEYILWKKRRSKKLPKKTKD